MNIKNTLISDLLKKDKTLSQQAAEAIINNKDIDAWKYLIENSDYIMDFIKNNASKKLLQACNEENIYNLFDFIEYHSPSFEDFVAQAFYQFNNQKIEEKMDNLIKNGTNEQKTYATKYFCLNPKKEITSILFEHTKSDYNPLSENSAQALGILKDIPSYEYYLEKLSSSDDWECLNSARFLSLYGNKNAILPLLKRMSTSSISEYICGEIASLEAMPQLLTHQKKEIQELALECFDNILSSLIQTWELSVVFDFEIKTCLEIILSNATTNKEPIGQYALLLLKAKNKFDLYNENKEYTFDEDKNTIDEIKNIYNLLHSYPEEFWEVQKDNLFEELNSTKKRKIACINLISELKMDYATDELLNMLNEDESIISVAILALSGFGAINTIKNKEEILEKINNPNLKAMIEAIFKTN